LSIATLALCWGFRRLRCRSATTGRLRPGVQILAARFREDLCLDADEVVEAAEGVVVPIDPVQ